MREFTELAQKAATQHGLLTVRQLRTMGFSRASLRRLLDNGVLVRVERGLVAMAGSLSSWEQEVMRICMSCRPWAVASHRTACRLWGIRTVDDEIDVSVRYPGDCRTPRGEVHRSRDLRPVDMTWIEGLPVTTPARTLCDAGLVLPEPIVGHLVNHSVATGLVTIRDLAAYRDRVARKGRNGVGAIRRILDEIGPQSEVAESGPEIELRTILRRAELPDPVPQHPVVVGALCYRIDLAFPTERIAIEYDGFVPHTQPERFEQDRRRQNALQLAGWTVLRFTATELKRPDAVVAAVRRALAQARLL